MKSVFKYLGLAVACIATFWLIDILTDAVNDNINKSSYNNPSYCYKIKNTSDLHTNVEYKTNNLIIQHFSSGEEDVYVAAIKTTLEQNNAEMRLTYNYAATLDTAIFTNLKYFQLESEKKPWYSYTIRRDYQFNDTLKVKTVTIFAREFIYVFYQSYSDSSYLIDRLHADFYSSRTFSFQNLISVWGDRYLSFSNLLRYIVGLLITLIWTIGWLYLCARLILLLPDPIIVVKKSFSGLFDKEKKSIPKLVLWYVSFIIIILLFSYLVLHDYFMDWIMSYGPFWKIPVGIFLVLFGGD